MIRQLDERTFVSGQIEPADVPELKAFGVGTIINNRPDGEQPGQPTGAEIERAAATAAMGYAAVPIARGIGPADVEAMREALDTAKGRVLAFCRTGNRSTLIWAVARRTQGASIDEIGQAAAAAGVDLTPVAHLL